MNMISLLAQYLKDAHGEELKQSSPIRKYGKNGNYLDKELYFEFLGKRYKITLKGNKIFSDDIMSKMAEVLLNKIDLKTGEVHLDGTEGIEIEDIAIKNKQNVSQ